MIAVFILTLLVNIYLKKYFSEYSERRQEDRNNKIAALIKNQYNDKLTWDDEVIQNIGISLLEEGLIIKLTDGSGRVVWDAMEYNSGICEKMIMSIKDRMDASYPSVQGNFINKTYFISVDKKTVGTLQIGFYSPFYYTDSEMIFINALNRLIIVIAVISLIASFAIGYIISGRLAVAISRVIASTGKISKGLYDIRISEISVIKEINDLTSSVNNLAASLEAQDNLRKRLTLDVSHELRTPLTTMQSHIEAMIDGVWDASEERLKSLHEEILRLSELVNDLTVLSRYEHENLKLEKTAVSIMSLIQDQLNMHEKQFLEKDISAVLSGDDIKINADRDKIKQVIINLISNAVKYTDIGGSFNIKISHDKGSVKLYFENSGESIPSKDLPFIFERFYRVDKSRTRSTGGAGIGLSIAREIILAHGGSIEASSSGNLTKFTVTLP